MDYLSLCLQLDRLAASQYVNYDFNSMCEFNGANIGANTSGIFTLDSGDLDGTSLIDSYFELPTTDFGAENQKRIRSFYIGCETNGQLLLTVKDDDSNERSWVIDPIHSDEKQHTIKVNGSRNGKGRYWMIRVETLSGADYSIDSISVLPILMNRKPSGN